MSVKKIMQSFFFVLVFHMVLADIFTLQLNIIMAGVNYLGSVPYNISTLNIVAPDTNFIQGKLGFKYQT